MKRQSAGFGLIELMVALTLGLIILLGVSQIFIAAKNTYLTQNSAAAMQEDARYGLSKMLQEVRMVGMFGCIATVTPDASAPDYLLAAATPISYVTTGTTQVLTLITGDVGSNGGTPNWTILTDCVSSPATVYGGAKAAGTGQIALPIRKVIYTYNSATQTLTTTVAGTAYTLLSNVSAFNVLFGMATDTSLSTPISSYNATPTLPGLIRSVRISITLTDPQGRLQPRAFSAVAGIRNRLP